MKVQEMVVTCVLLLSALLMLQTPVSAGSKKINFQGKVTDSAGNDINGQKSITFRLYANESAAYPAGAVWFRTSSVSISSGIFNVTLEDGTPSLDTLSFDKPYWLGVEVDGNSEMSPRQPISASGYALGSLSSFNAAGSVYAGGSVISSGSVSAVGNVSAAGNMSTAGKLGIGTSNPQAPLHLLSSGEGKALVETTSNGVGRAAGLYLKTPASQWSFLAYDGYSGAGYGTNLHFLCGNTPTMVLTSEANGARAGIGTKTPVNKLDVCTTQNADGINVGAGVSNAEASSCVYLRPSSGNADQRNWAIGAYKDNPGSLFISNSNAAWGNAYTGTTRFLINKDGKVGIGTTAPQAQLEIATDSSLPLSLRKGNYVWNNVIDSGGFYIWENNQDMPAITVLRNLGSGVINRVGIGTAWPAAHLKLDVNGIIRCTSIDETSDIRYKENIEVLPQKTMEKLANVRALKYRLKKGQFKDKDFSDQPQIGVSAQEIEQVYPELVSTDENGYKAVSYTRLTVVLLQALKEQQSTITALESRIAALENGKKR